MHKKTPIGLTYFCSMFLKLSTHIVKIIAFQAGIADGMLSYSVWYFHVWSKNSQAQECVLRSNIEANREKRYKESILVTLSRASSELFWCLFALNGLSRKHLQAILTNHHRHYTRIHTFYSWDADIIVRMPHKLKFILKKPQKYHLQRTKTFLLFLGYNFAILITTLHA